MPSCKATIDARNLGAVAPLREQPKLGWLFAIGRASFDAFAPETFCNNKSNRVCCT